MAFIHEVPENFKNANYISDRFSKRDIAILAIGISIGMFVGFPPLIYMFVKGNFSIIKSILYIFEIGLPIAISIILVSPVETYHSVYLKIVYLIKNKRKQKIFKYQRLD